MDKLREIHFFHKQKFKETIFCKKLASKWSLLVTKLVGTKSTRL